MPLDETAKIPPSDATPAIKQELNLQPGSMGILGPAAQVMHTTAMVVITCLLIWFVWNERQDRVYDRELFRETVRDLQSQADRHTGEIKGSMDKNTEVMRDLIQEIRVLRHGTGIKPAELKPINPSPNK